jgi:hypothetical protein
VNWIPLKIALMNKENMRDLKCLSSEDAILCPKQISTSEDNGLLGYDAV